MFETTSVISPEETIPGIETAKKVFGWVKDKMLTPDDGKFGMYERWRINLGRRTNWVRPDCNLEMARAMTIYAGLTGSNEYHQIRDNLVNWALSAQSKDSEKQHCGGFPFYLVEGKDMDEGQSLDNLWPNDLGKILRNLCWLYGKLSDERLLNAAKLLADFFLRKLSKDGTFPQADTSYGGICCRLWPAVGLACIYDLTGDVRYADASKFTFEKAMELQKESGRFVTSYEMPNNKGCSEDWRPVSSETSIAMKCFCIAYTIFKDEVYKNVAKKAGQWVLNLQNEDGAIMNSDCSKDSEGSSLQRDDLTDLVYTNGFALMGFAQMMKHIDPLYKNAYEKLRDFLIDIQCQGESQDWDGAWRGSYDPARKCWDGSCDMNNELDEGGQYSVYTGWCVAPNTIGILCGELDVL